MPLRDIHERLPFLLNFINCGRGRISQRRSCWWLLPAKSQNQRRLPSPPRLPRSETAKNPTTFAATFSTTTKPLDFFCILLLLGRGNWAEALLLHIHQVTPLYDGICLFPGPPHPNSCNASTRADANAADSRFAHSLPITIRLRRSTRRPTSIAVTQSTEETSTA